MILSILLGTSSCAAMKQVETLTEENVNLLNKNEDLTEKNEGLEIDLHTMCAAYLERANFNTVVFMGGNTFFNMITQEMMEIHTVDKECKTFIRDFSTMTVKRKEEILKLLLELPEETNKSE